MSHDTDNKWIPRYFILFFVILAILDGIFVYIATSTHRGTITDHAYEKGLNYNETIKASHKQDTLGWQGIITYEDELISFKLLDQLKNPLENASVTAYFTRVMNDGSDFSIALTDQHNGIYDRSITLPYNGPWDIRIGATWKQHHYQQSIRINLR